MRAPGRRFVAAVAVTAVAAAGLAGCSTDAAGQKVIDQLSQLNVMTVPAGATELSRTSVKGGGNSAIRNSSWVTLVYATPQTPAEVGQSFHARFDPTWHFHDSGAIPPDLWRGSGLPKPNPTEYPDTVADVRARGVTPADEAPAGSQSVVTVTVVATRLA